MSDGVTGAASGGEWSEARLNAVLNQYDIAVDLYKHEDQLNWSKLNHLLYITGGLGALFGFFLNHRDSIRFQYIDPLVMVSLLGVLVSGGFAVVIWMGIRYLALRKEEIMKMELGLVRVTGHSVVCPSELAARGSLPDRSHPVKTSHTTLVLRAFPLAILALWLLILIAVVAGEDASCTTAPQELAAGQEGGNSQP